MVHLVKSYLPALAALPAGAAAGLAVAWAAKRSRIGGGRLGPWDARTTLPLLVAAAAAHLALLPVVEQLRVVLFTLYAISLLGTVGLAIAGIGVWRAGAVLLPLGSIAGYFYFALLFHSMDAVGLLVKLVEVLAIAAAMVPVLRQQPAGERWSVS
jgi:hypothetical protein